MVVDGGGGSGVVEKKEQKWRTKVRVCGRSWATEQLSMCQAAPLRLMCAVDDLATLQQSVIANGDDDLLKLLLVVSPVVIHCRCRRV